MKDKVLIIGAERSGTSQYAMALSHMGYDLFPFSKEPNAVYIDSKLDGALKRLGQGPKSPDTLAGVLSLLVDFFTDPGKQALKLNDTNMIPMLVPVLRDFADSTTVIQVSRNPLACARWIERMEHWRIASALARIARAQDKWASFVTAACRKVDVFCVSHSRTSAELVSQIGEYQSLDARTKEAIDGGFERASEAYMRDSAPPDPMIAAIHRESGVILIAQSRTDPFRMRRAIVTRKEGSQEIVELNKFINETLGDDGPNPFKTATPCSAFVADADSIVDLAVE